MELLNSTFFMTCSLCSASALYLVFFSDLFSGYLNDLLHDTKQQYIINGGGRLTGVQRNGFAYALHSENLSNPSRRVGYYARSRGGNLGRNKII